MWRGGRGVAEVFKSSMRSSNSVCVWGGGGMVVIQNTSYSGIFLTRSFPTRSKLASQIVAPQTVCGKPSPRKMTDYKLIQVSVLPQFSFLKTLNVCSKKDVRSLKIKH